MVNLFSIYTPHNGYSIEQKRLFWKSVRNAYKHTCKKSIIVTGIDANGELGAANNGNKHQKTIGPWTNAVCTEKGNGLQLRNFCTNNNMIATNTWYQQQKRTDNTEYVTWTHPNGAIKRQIDYILINKRYQNCVRNCYSMRNWTANPNLVGQQHNPVLLKIQLRKQNNAKKLAEKQKEKNNYSPYNIPLFRQQPERLRTHIETKKCQIQQIFDISNLNSDNAIKKIENNITEMLCEIYPKTEKVRTKREHYLETHATDEQKNRS